MKGIILFADDHVFTESRDEKSLYEAIRNDGNHPVLGIDDLELVQNALHSISNFKAFIIDWSFDPKEADEFKEMGVSVDARLSRELLLHQDTDIFSIIYLYSELDIENTEDGTKLKEKFGNRIIFRKKVRGQVEEEKKMILEDIERREVELVNLKVAFNWSKTINRVVQKIFTELFEADPNWIVDLYKTANEDGVTPSIEVITLFQYLLSEKVIQNKELRDDIDALANANPNGQVTEPESYSKLFSRFYYTESCTDDPIMTGDIYLLDEPTKKYGIIISPECDVRHICNSQHNHFELLTFKDGDFGKNAKKEFNPVSQTINQDALRPKIEDILQDIPIEAKQKTKLINKINNKVHAEISEKLSKDRSELFENNLKLGFTQTIKRIHILPSFPFTSGKYNQPAWIDFRSGKIAIIGNELSKFKRVCKLNSPYIQDLRQRYLSYIGRVGVASLPESIRKLNIS